MSIFLASAAFGNVDVVKPLPALPNEIYAHMNTDQPVDPRIAATWSALVAPPWPRNEFSPRLRSQYFKHQIHRHEAAPNYRWLVWADASLHFFELDFIVEWAERLEDEPWERRALFIPHPQRSNINDEANFICEQIAANNEYVKRRYTADATFAQMQWLIDAGYSTEATLYCGGFWMIENSPRSRGLLNDWWDQNLRFGAIDQLALGALLCEEEYEPHRLEIDLFSNQHFAFVAHP